MKTTLLIAFILVQINVFAQNMIYLKDGGNIPAKILEINNDTVKFKNLANPLVPFYSIDIKKLALAINDHGNYLIFERDKPLTGSEKQAFINPTDKQRQFDIILNEVGKLSAINILDENETEIAALDSGSIIYKNQLRLLIRKNGSHVFFSYPDTVFLANNTSKINALAFANTTKQQTSSKQNVKDYKSTSKNDTKPPVLSHCGFIDELNRDTLGLAASISIVQAFCYYLKSIESVHTDSYDASKSIGLACDLFLNQGVASRVEVSNNANAEVHKYLIHDYLVRLMIKAGQFDKVNVEFVEFNYATNLRKGFDGNWYRTVSFIQKMTGFIDGNVVYRERTNQNLTIIDKPFTRCFGYYPPIPIVDVFLGDIGISEIRKH